MYQDEKKRKGWEFLWYMLLVFAFYALGKFCHDNSWIFVSGGFATYAFLAAQHWWELRKLIRKIEDLYE